MNWSKHGRGKGRRGYHHGNLREALVDAALELIGSKGAAGFTFAEAARTAGVSPAAPYRHFRDRDALMADVAQRGFEKLADRLAKAWDTGRPNPLAALHNLGRAYLAFANDEPALYTAMYEAGLPPDLNPELAVAGDKALAVLRDACETLCATLPPDKRPPVTMVSLHIWALAHGMASLFSRGDEARRPLPMPPDDLLEASLLIYLEGLGLRNDG